MKWYSVKEHTPLLTICCVFLVVRHKPTNRVSIVLGEWDCGRWKYWEDNQEDIEDCYNEVIYFCYPDPIPRCL